MRSYKGVICRNAHYKVTNQKYGCTQSEAGNLIFKSPFSLRLCQAMPSEAHLLTRDHALRLLIFDPVFVRPPFFFF